MKTLVRICLIIGLAFALSGCGLLGGYWRMHHPSPTPLPGETVAPATPMPSLGTGTMSCVVETWALVHTASQPVNMDILDQTQTIIQNRLTRIGIPAAVTLHEPDEFTVTSPTWVDADELHTLIGQTGKLLFIAVSTEFASTIAEGRPLPAGMPATPIFGMDQVASARAGSDNAGLPAIDLTLKSEGASLFDAYAANHQGDRFAIVMDGIVQYAPTINSTHFGGEAQIVGNLTQAQADLLVAVLSYGYLPLPVTSVQSAPGNCAAIGS